MSDHENSDGFEKYVMLRFSDKSDLKEFVDVLREIESGELVKTGGRDSMQSEDNDRRSNGNGKKKTLWSKFGASKYDEKKTEKSGLPHPKSSKGVPGSD